MEALKLYPAESQEELSFNQGDVMKIIRKHSSGWWKAELNGKEGLIPGNFVKEVAPPVSRRRSSENPPLSPPSNRGHPSSRKEEEQSRLTSLEVLLRERDAELAAAKEGMQRLDQNLRDLQQKNREKDEEITATLTKAKEASRNLTWANDALKASKEALKERELKLEVGTGENCFSWRAETLEGATEGFNEANLLGNSAGPQGEVFKGLVYSTEVVINRIASASEERTLKSLKAVVALLTW